MSQTEFGDRGLEYPTTVSEAVRQANQQIARKALQLRFVARAPFICECSDPDCQEFILLHPLDYATQSQRGYVTLPGHDSRHDGDPHSQSGRIEERRAAGLDTPGSRESGLGAL